MGQKEELSRQGEKLAGQGGGGEEGVSRKGERVIVYGQYSERLTHRRHAMKGK